MLGARNARKPLRLNVPVLLLRTADVQTIGAQMAAGVAAVYLAISLEAAVAVAGDNAAQIKNHGQLTMIFLSL